MLRSLSPEIGAGLIAAKINDSVKCRCAQQALAPIEHQGSDAEVLDVSPGDETSAPIANGLIRSGTPFVVVSGLHPSAQLAEIFQTVPLIGKPLRAGVLEAELSGAWRGCRAFGEGWHYELEKGSP